MTREHARYDEQQIRQAIQILQHLVGNRFGFLDSPGAAFGTSCDRASEMTCGCCWAATWQDEFLQRRQGRVQSIELLFKMRNVFALDRAMTGNRQLAAQVEQLV